MGTWDVVTNMVTRFWPDARRGDRKITLLLEVGGREQKVVIEDRATSVAIVATICERRFLELTNALEINATTRIGAVAIQDGSYVLRHLVPLGQLTPDRLHDAIVAAALEATQRAREVTRPVLPDTTFHAVFAYVAD